MPLSSLSPRLLQPPSPTHVRVFAEAKVAGFPYMAWKVVTTEEWDASTPEQRRGWRDEARDCLLGTIAIEKGQEAADAALVTY
ncbi:hypothetical protein ACWGDX_13155 [Streptomyces sp. NPDC055025]